MNRQERRAMVKEQHAYVKQRPAKLTLVPRDEWPRLDETQLPMRCWVSRDYLVQLYDVIEFPPEPAYIIYRMSVCRVRLSKSGTRWQDNLTWDELQTIKREIGFGDWYGVEVYPRDCDVVNVANIRHVWLMELPLSIGWRSDRGE